MINWSAQRCIALCFAALVACFISAPRHIAVAATAIGVQGPRQIETATAEHIQKAREAIAAERYDDAKKELKIALSLDNKSPAANLCLAFVFKQENKSKDAIKCVQTAIQSQPNYPDAHYLYAQLLFEKNDLVMARREIDLAISQGANIRNAYVLSGDIYLAQPNNQLALECYEKALGLPGPIEGATVMRERIGAIANNVAFKSHRGDPSYVLPKQLNLPRPVYTEEARNRGVQGAVKSGIIVNEQGRVSYVLIFSGLGFGLDAEALKAAQRLRFSPATIDGKPVPYWLNLIIEFNLRIEFNPPR